MNAPLPHELHRLARLLGMMEQPREEASSFDWEAEYKRRRESERQRRAEGYRRWCVELADELKVALDDVHRATRMQPTLRRARMTLSWNHFAWVDWRAAHELCQRLAEISRATPEGEPPDKGAIAAALADAGLGEPSRG
jgi:hypothetical protein